MSSLPTINPSARSSLDEFLHEHVESRRVPAMFLGATNAKEEIYFNYEGERVFGDASKGQVDDKTVVECWSQTKLFTCVCAMQLVDQGLVSLDSTEDIEKHLPELAALPLLKGFDDEDKPILVERERKVTLRMLMSHSAGTCYPHANPLIIKWASQQAKPPPPQFIPEAGIAALLVPFVYEPGTSWQYSNGIDWTGLLVERVSNAHTGLSQKLGDYMTEHLFNPVGATSLTFVPDADSYSRKMAVCERAADADGTVVVTDTGCAFGRKPNQPDPAFHFGGQGLFGNQRDYLKVLRGLLACDPKWGVRDSKPLLSPESYAELFKPSVPKVDIAKGYDGPTHIMEMVSKPKYLDPPGTVDTVNHSIACLITLEDQNGRRRAGSACWSGVAKTQWWIDPTTGLAGICATQLLAPAPDHWFQVYVAYEKVLYAALA